MQTKETISSILAAVGSRVIGKEQVLRTILCAILAGGHILIDDIPGVGKTTMAVAFTHALGLSYKRMQFTPDVLPSDITGFSMYDKSTNSFRYMPGAAMTNLFLADEINRASPKTQSALLEVMQEGTVSVDGTTYAVPKPFIVIATQNPAGSSGTQELPDSQTDRFMIRITMGYPSIDEEVKILSGAGMEDASSIAPVISADILASLQKQTAAIHTDPSLFRYMASIADATRHNDDIALGMSPRGTLALLAMAKANALMEGRDYVIPDDVHAIYLPTLCHRIRPASDARLAGKTAADILASIMKSVPLPSLSRV